MAYLGNAVNSDYVSLALHSDVRMPWKVTISKTQQEAGKDNSIQTMEHN